MNKTSNNSVHKEAEVKKLKKQLKKLENKYGELLETCSPNPEVCGKLVDYIDSAFKKTNCFKIHLYTTMHSQNKEMKSALRKQYQQKLFELNDDNNPFQTYAKANGIIELDDNEGESPTKMLAEKVSSNKSSKSCCIIF